MPQLLNAATLLSLSGRPILALHSLRVYLSRGCMRRGGIAENAGDGGGGLQGEEWQTGAGDREEDVAEDSCKVVSGERLEVLKRLWFGGQVGDLA